MPLIARPLADEMAAQLEAAWREVKGPDVPFPETDGQDSLIMFLAVARGLLRYMEAHQNETISSIALSGGSAQTVTSMDLNITTPL